MGMINLFRRLLVVQVLLGIVALGMAERNPVLMLIVGALACLSWYVTEGPTGRLMPRWLTLVCAVMAVVWLPMELIRNHGHLVVPVAHFVMWLQILLLYSDKTNREYGQILVLSVLQMISAAMISHAAPTLVFAAVLLAYCVVGLVTVLAFHLKIVSDAVQESNQLAAPKGTLVGSPHFVAGHGHRWQFRMTAVGLAVGCGGVAVAVFLVTPRSEPLLLTEGMLRQVAPRRSGFSSRLDLRGAPSILEDREPVLSLTLTGADFTDYGTDRLLRGAALDLYDSRDHVWRRSDHGAVCSHILDLPPGGERLLELDSRTDVRRASITLFETERKRLFAFHPPSLVDSSSFHSVVVNLVDDSIDARDAIEFPVTYKVEAPIRSDRKVRTNYRRRFTLQNSDPNGSRPEVLEPHEAILANYARGWSVQRDRIGRLARGVLEQAGLQRERANPPSASDELAAEAMSEHLRHHFRYTLRNPATMRGRDPIIAFLFEQRSGHCELFASALTAMARSIGMRARVVTGYRVSEFNVVGGYYIVRRRNAHAWTEVDCGPSGWQSIDPTPPEDLAMEHATSDGVLTTLRDLYEHMEFAWVRTVVSFNEQKRTSILSGFGQSLLEMTRENAWGGKALAWWRRMIGTWRSDRVVLIFIAATIFFILLGLATLARILVVRRRRLVALQLTCLPRHQRRLLARRLKFYLIMLDRLERHGFVRPVWMSPFGFAQQLATSDRARFTPVLALTELFYEVRFGYRALDEDRRRRIRAYLHDLEVILTPKTS